MVDNQSSESACFSLALHEFEYVSDPDWSFDVSDEVAFVGFFSGDEDDFDLGDAAARAGPSQELRHSGLDGF